MCEFNPVPNQKNNTAQGKSVKKQPLFRPKSGPQIGKSPGTKKFVPAAFTNVVTGSAPMYLARSANNPSGIRVRHREYIGEMISSATASLFINNFALPINPGIASSFPWLSNVAIQYESYRVHAISYSFSTEGVTTNGGSIVLSIDYDASDAAPAGKQQAMSYHSSVRSAPWEDCNLMAIPSELHKIGPTRYVRSGTVANTDLKTYDAGNFFASSSLPQASALIG